MKWRIDSIGRRYDPGERAIVYFDARSGDTHLLTDFAVHILDQFDAKSLTTGDLVARVAATIEPGDIPDLEAVVSGVLTELAALDILKPE